MNGALTGLKVLDFTRVLAGPYCTMMLADMGAEVVKVEAIETGDDSRQFGPYINGESAYFMSVNRNKKSMTMNLKKPESIALIKQMVGKVDVLVENFKPGTMEKLGIGYEVLREINPKLIYAAASGFGHTGPYSPRPAYDAVVQAMGGLMSITGPDGGEPTRVGTSIADITAGLFCAIGVLAAVCHLKDTGIGQKIDVAMLDCQLAILENAIARYMVTGVSPKPQGNRHPSIVPFETFDTADGVIMISVGNDNLWAKFCRAIGKEEYIDDERFDRNPKRFDNYKILRPLMAEVLMTKTTAQWQKIFDGIGVPNGPVNSIEMAVNDPQVIAREMIVEVDHPVAGMTKVPGIAIKMSETPGSIAAPAPVLGQHTGEILAGLLGKSQSEIAHLREIGAI
jgi:CoA:oxalate CoA-transferase